MNATPARPGLVVMDVSLNMVACNADAIQILTFPDNPEKISDLRGWLTRKIRSCLLDRQSCDPTQLRRRIPVREADASLSRVPAHRRHKSQ